MSKNDNLLDDRFEDLLGDDLLSDDSLDLDTQETEQNDEPIDVNALPKDDLLGDGLLDGDSLLGDSAQSVSISQTETKEEPKTPSYNNTNKANSNKNAKKGKKNSNSSGNAGKQKATSSQEENPFWQKDDSPFAETQKKGDGKAKIVRKASQGADNARSTTNTDFPVLAYGKYSFAYKALTFLLIVGLSFGIGYAATFVCEQLELMYLYVLKYLPLFNAGVMILYYIFFAVRKYNYKKNGVKDAPTDSKSKDYRKMNYAYYSTVRGLIWLIYVVLFDVSVILGSNLLYGLL